MGEREGPGRGCTLLRILLLFWSLIGDYPDFGLFLETAILGVCSFSLFLETAILGVCKSRSLFRDLPYSEYVKFSLFLETYILGVWNSLA